MKRARNKRVHIVWFHLHKILDNPNESVLTESRPGSPADRQAGWGAGGGNATGWGNVCGRRYTFIILLCGDGFMTVHICQSSLNYTLCNVQFIVYQLNSNTAKNNEFTEMNVMRE